MDIKYFLLVVSLSFAPVAFAWDGSIGGVDGSISEADRALLLMPNVENGKKLYAEKRCISCHGVDGMGSSSAKGVFPRIAGQHTSVILKQLSDFRSGNRASVIMKPYALPENVGGQQAMADVAGYINTLTGSDSFKKGDESDAKAGQAVYEKGCISCHGASGEGNDFQRFPRLQGQHYDYLVAQVESMKQGLRKRSNPDMLKVIEPMNDDEIKQVAAYLSHLTLSDEALDKAQNAQLVTEEKSTDQDEAYLKALKSEAGN